MERLYKVLLMCLYRDFVWYLLMLVYIILYFGLFVNLGSIGLLFHRFIDGLSARLGDDGFV